MSEFPVFRRTPPSTAALVLGHPALGAAAVSMLFLYIVFFIPMSEAFPLLLFFGVLVPLFLVPLAALNVFFAFRCGRCVAASILAVLLLGMLLFFSQINSAYETLRFRVLEPQMQTAAEEILADLPAFTEYTSYYLPLPEGKRHLSRGGSVYIEGFPNAHGANTVTVAFVRASGLANGGAYYAYRNPACGGWCDFRFVKRREPLDDMFCLIYF